MSKDLLKRLQVVEAEPERLHPFSDKPVKKTPDLATEKQEFTVQLVRAPDGSGHVGVWVNESGNVVHEFSGDYDKVLKIYKGLLQGVTELMKKIKSLK